MSDIANRLRGEAPYSEVGELMLRAASALEWGSGSGTPAFVSLVGVVDGPVEVTGRVRDVLEGQGWVAPDQLERLLDESFDAGFAAAKRDAA